MVAEWRMLLLPAAKGSQQEPRGQTVLDVLPPHPSLTNHASSAAHHFVLMIDGGSPAQKMLHHLQVALGGRALQARVASLKHIKQNNMKHGILIGE